MKGNTEIIGIYHPTINYLVYKLTFYGVLLNGRVKVNIAPIPSALFLAHISPP